MGVAEGNPGGKTCSKAKTLTQRDWSLLAYALHDVPFYIAYRLHSFRDRPIGITVLAAQDAAHILRTVRGYNV